MAGGEVSKKELGPILMQAMSAAKTIRVQRDRLLRLHRLLRKATTAAAGDAHAPAGRLGRIVHGLADIYFSGLNGGAHYLTLCLTMAAEKGARFPLNLAFAVMPEEQLYDALLSQRLPARPATQAEAFSRIEAAVFATKLPQEHHVRRCLEHLGVNVRRCLEHLGVNDTAAAAAEPTPTQEDTVAAATETVAKISLSDPAAAVTEPPHPQAGSLDQALSCLHRACVLVNLAVKHTDLAVTVLSRFLDPKDVAESKKMADEWAYVSKSDLDEDENRPSE